MRFKQYSAKDIQKVSPDIIHRITAITGWEVPSGALLNALLIEVELFLKESCNDINLDELLFAVRNYSKQVKDWGKLLNLNLISEVIDLYLIDRYRVSQLEEKSKPAPQKIYTTEELEAIQRWDIEAFYQRCLKGIIPPPQLPEYFVTILNKDGIEVKDDNEAQQYFSWCINNGVKNLYIRK